MTDPVDAILNAPRKTKRRMIALAGPPAAGKSTLADRLCHALNSKGCATQVIPMDGFHLDNRLLDARGLRARKGAPNTFDVAGLRSLLDRVAKGQDVIFPLFDRAQDLAIAGAGHLSKDCDTVIVEGNYLLLQTPPWSSLASIWDFTISIDVPKVVLHARLVQRWRRYGHTMAEAEARARGNDFPNCDVVMSGSRKADQDIKGM